MAISVLLMVLAALSCCGVHGPSTPSDDAKSAAVVASPPIEECKDPFARSGKLKFSTTGWKTDFCKHSVPYNEVRSGGPPRDGIPPIDEPTFVSQSQADTWLKEVEPVIALEVNGVARAYPLQVLIWHEIVNDEINGKAVSVTFCPLCYAAVVFGRPTIDGKVLSFGTSGNLRKSDMVMWDRETESWWQQFEGKAIVGSLTGTQLEVLPASIVSWRSFKSAYPEAEVLSRDTGIDRPYGANPYVGYDDISKKPFLYQGKVEKGLPPMAHIVGVDRGDLARAYSVEQLRADRVLVDSLGGEELLILWQPGTASALDAKGVAEGDDAGATGVFLRKLDGKSVTLSALNDQVFVDEESRSHWNIFGRAVSGPLAGRQLEAVAHHRVFWFAWSAFVAERGSLFQK